MNISRNYLIAGGVGAALLLSGLAYWLWGGDGTPATSQISSGACTPIQTVTVTKDDFVIGTATAPITLVEYGSQTCSVCARFQTDVLPRLSATYIKTGLVRFVFRDFQRNRIDVAASVLGRCLGREAFLPFTDMLFENQAVWMNREDQDVLAGLKEMTRRAGMSEADFLACMKNDGEAQRLVAQTEKASKDYCVDGTPTFLLNGTKVDVRGSMIEDLDAALRAELKKIGVTPPPLVDAASAASE
jgi:protein-disulfide isomerase